MPVEALDDSDTVESIQKQFLGGTANTDMRISGQLTSDEVGA